MKVLEDERDAFGAEPLDLEKFKRGGREPRQQYFAPLAGASVDQFGEDMRQTLADPGNVGDLARGVAQDIDNPLRETLYRGRAASITADAETVFARNLHEVSGLPQQSRDFLILQTGSSPHNCNDSNSAEMVLLHDWRVLWMCGNP